MASNYYTGQLFMAGRSASYGIDAYKPVCAGFGLEIFENIKIKSCDFSGKFSAL